MSLERFERRIRLRANNLPGEVNRVVRQAALAADQAIVTATPVDTGRARSNWLVSLGSPREEVVPPYSPLPKGTDPGKLGEADNARAAIAQGLAVIGRRPPNVPIFITNNVHYIGELNAGSSAQAPAAFVEAAVDAAVAAVQGMQINTARGGLA